MLRYDIYRDGGLIASTAATTYSDDAALVDGVYAYTVRAADVAGNVSTPSLSASIRIDRVEPPAPVGLTVPTPTKLPHLTWTQASDAGTGGSGIAEYHVYRNGVRIGDRRDRRLPATRPSRSTTPTATPSPPSTAPATSRIPPAPPRCCSTTRRRRRRAA